MWGRVSLHNGDAPQGFQSGARLSRSRPNSISYGSDPRDLALLCPPPSVKCHRLARPQSRQAEHCGWRLRAASAVCWLQGHTQGCAGVPHQPHHPPLPSLPLQGRPSFPEVFNPNSAAECLDDPGQNYSSAGTASYFILRSLPERRSPCDLLLQPPRYLLCLTRGTQQVLIFSEESRHWQSCLLLPYQLIAVIISSIKKERQVPRGPNC